MKRYLSVAAIVLIYSSTSFGQSKSDTTYPYTLSVTPRLNSIGYFPFTGAVLNKNRNFDMNLVFVKHNYGFLAFKSVDLQDKKSDINYLQSAVFGQLQIGKSVKTGLYLGYLFSQTSEFRDKAGSDYFGAWTVYLDVNKNFRIENITLVNDVSTQIKFVNRLLFIYTFRQFRFNLSVHQRDVVETSDFSASTISSISLPKLKITERVSGQMTFAYIKYITSNRPDYAMNNGFLVSLAFPIDLDQ